MTGGPWFRGRGLAYDPDRRDREERRQRWTYRIVDSDNGRLERGQQAISELEQMAALDPAEEYERHRANYIRTGSDTERQLMLEYVQP